MIFQGIYIQIGQLQGVPERQLFPPHSWASGSQEMFRKTDSRPHAAIKSNRQEGRSARSSWLRGSPLNGYERNEGRSGSAAQAETERVGIQIPAGPPTMTYRRFPPVDQEVQLAGWWL